MIDAGRDSNIEVGPQFTTQDVIAVPDRPSICKLQQIDSFLPNPRLSFTRRLLHSVFRNANVVIASPAGEYQKTSAFCSSTATWLMRHSRHYSKTSGKVRESPSRSFTARSEETSTASFSAVCNSNDDWGWSLDIRNVKLRQRGQGHWISVCQSS